MIYTEQSQKSKGPHAWALRLRMFFVRTWLRFLGPRWSVGVLAVMLDTQGRVCLCKHRGRLKPWGLPGGLAAWPESPEQALRRELHEELGWDACSGRSFSLRQSLLSEKFPLLELVFQLEGAVNALEIARWVIQDSEIEKVCWFGYEELVKLDGILDRHRTLVMDVLRHP